MSKNNIAETVARRTILNWIYANMLILSASTFFEKHLELFGIICDYLSLRYYFFQIRYIYICLVVKYHSICRIRSNISGRIYY